MQVRANYILPRNEKVVGSIPTGGSAKPQLKACVSWGSLHALRRQDGGGFVQVVGARGEHRANKSRTEKPGFQ